MDKGYEINFWLNKSLIYLTLIVLFLCLLMADLLTGAVSTSISDLLRALLHPNQNLLSMLIYSLRLPRVASVIMIGAGLAVAGAAMQGLLRNPLADPGLLGVSSGACLGQIIFWIVLAHHVHLKAAVLLLQPLFVFSGGLAAVAILYALSYLFWRGFAGLLLIGMAFNALLAALIVCLLTMLPGDYFQNALLWSFGSVQILTWNKIALLGLIIFSGCTLLFYQSRQFDLLGLGEDIASNLGANLARLKLFTMLGVALLVSASMAVAGPIAFVGLLVPHSIRQLLGSTFRHVLMGSCLGGGILLLLADILSQAVLAPKLIPLGVVVSLIGAPVLIFLLLRKNHD